MINILLFLGGTGSFELIILLLFLPLIWLALRPVLLWYWKVNSVEKLLKEQNQLLRSIHDQLSDSSERDANYNPLTVEEKAKLFDKKSGL